MPKTATAEDAARCALTDKLSFIPKSAGRSLKAETNDNSAYQHRNCQVLFKGNEAIISLTRQERIAVA